MLIKMNKQNTVFFGKRFFAVLLVILCIAAALSGCKVEFPDHVAADAPTVSDSASFENDASSLQNSQSSQTLSQTSEDSSDSSKDSTSSQTSKSSPSPSSQNSGKTENNNPPDSSSSSSVASSQTPSATPKPVEPEDTTVDGNKPFTCTMSITCKTILDNMDLFNKDKLGVLPKDGIIYAERTVIFYEGESVFDILARETKKNRIHMEHESFPIYNSEYIEGINNIYEFDCGEGSGWMYQVNGLTPNYGCSRYQVKPGDKIEWIYTCDLGHDIGGGMNR